MKYRHGDVIIEKIENLPNEPLTKLDRKELAFGEVTGHAHRIDVGELFETKDGKLYLKTEKFANLTHEEHKCIVLNPGVYKVTIKRQYAPDENWEPVTD